MARGSVYSVANSIAVYRYLLLAVACIQPDKGYFGRAALLVLLPVNGVQIKSTLEDTLVKISYSARVIIRPVKDVLFTHYYAMCFDTLCFARQCHLPLSL